MTRTVPLFLLMTLFASGLAPAAEPQPYGNTQPLTWDDDIASRLVDGVDRFLLRALDESIESRGRYWKRDGASADAYNRSLEPNRSRLAYITGTRDPRVEFAGLELLGTTERPALVGRGAGYKVFAVRWPAFGDVHGEGLLLTPTDREPVADVVAVPDADVAPEALVGLIDGMPPQSQYARRLAESGCRVLVPSLIDRTLEKRNGRANLTSREYLYRPAFELGRHLIGYELQKILAGVDWFVKEAPNGNARVGVVGWGEGGLLALYAAALDPRVDAALVSGYFDSRQNIWQEPLDRNVYGLLDQFGDAELASMVAPRALVIEAARGPELTLPSEGGAPARLVTPQVETVRREVERAKALVPSTLSPETCITLVVSGDGQGACASPAALDTFLQKLAPDAKLSDPGAAPQRLAAGFDIRSRQARQMHEIDRHNQALLSESPYVRAEFMKKLDASSLESYEKSVETYRDHFRNQTIGHFELERLPFNARSRKTYDEAKWTGYEVVLDVFPDVIAYGILCIPKDIPAGERRPVVVCQHGLEGRPQDVVAGGHRAYHDFAAKLAERGFITFAPQNLYIFKDRFRTLQRKANPIQKTLFSVIVPQHQQIVAWLSTLDMVDPDRIGFYGLSYGGKSAMRIPPLVPEYKLSICSADFNEWVWKNASSRAPHSYVWTGEYEIFEFDLGSTFNYAEMAALICPRPFMVERGHFDGVAPDETVAYEFAKVRHLYNARLGLGDRTEIEWFVGPHAINGQATFAFLHKHLEWPAPTENAKP